MNRPLTRLVATGLPLGIALAGCRSAAPTPPGSAVPPAPAAATVSPADVHFMSGMIVHHAQAVLMAGWAPTHGASPAVRTLCEKIIVSQRDEIALMERWLADRHQALPDTTMVPGHGMPGMDQPMRMPGMLTLAQLARLDGARGPEFDRLFLTDMIQHHVGALTMVQDLLDTPGAAQDGLVYQYATDVNADQTVEIDRMHRMLAALSSDEKQP